MKELKFLEYFEANKRSGAINILLKPIRAGKTNINDVALWLEEDCKERLRYNKSQQVGQMLIAIKDTEALQEAINYYVEWEKLSFAEKEKIKSEKAKSYIENSMKGKEATQKQINFLESRGISVWKNERSGLPIQLDRYECAELINKIIGK